jgi:hypothetical protein
MFRLLLDYRFIPAANTAEAERETPETVESKLLEVCYSFLKEKFDSKRRMSPVVFSNEYSSPGMRQSNLVKLSNESSSPGCIAILRAKLSNE